MNADSRSLEVRDGSHTRLDAIVRDLQKAEDKLADRFTEDVAFAERLDAIVRAAGHPRPKYPPARPQPRVSTVAALRGPFIAVWRQVVRWLHTVIMTTPGDPAGTGDCAPDNRWLEQLWDAHHHDIARYLARQVDPSAVDDLVQQTFIAAWRQRAQIEDDPRAWLFGVAKNLVRRHWRWHQRERLAWEDQLATQQILANDGGIRVTELAADIRGAWHRLTQNERECIHLSVIHGLNDAEIAAVQRTSKQNVRQRRRRARWKLYTALGDSPTGVVVRPRLRRG